MQFPSYTRRLAGGYASLSSAHLARVVGERLRERAGSDVLLDAEAVDVRSGVVTLRDGRQLVGQVVVDGRGAPDGIVRGVGSFQKFLGLEGLTSRPHGIVVRS